MLKFPGLSRLPSNHDGNASPSIFLEKGAHRMRAPRSRQNSDLARPRAQVHKTSQNSTQLLLLVVLLASACISCFGAAYYLFTTRWGPVILGDSRHSADNNLEVIPSDSQLILVDKHEKYLAYLPHSGFHNQRIAFENALTLARLMNRTLIVPPVRLGNKPLRYVHFDALLQFTALSGKDGLEHCSKVPQPLPLPPECFDYFDYTHLSWQWLVDLSSVTSQQRVVLRWDARDSWIQNRLDISESDTLTLKDASPYHYRFLDTLTDASPPKDKFKEDMYIPHLALSSKRLIQIGTLFGSSRLRLKTPANIRLRGEVRRSMSFDNPTLFRVVDAIAESLTGRYLGAHIRVGDGQFRLRGEENARQIWWKLVNSALGFNVEETLAIEGAFWKPSSPVIPLRSRRTCSQSLATPSTDLCCRGQLHTDARLTGLNMPLYISTDASDPANDPSLAGFLRTFPCTFFLADFNNQTRTLDRLINGYDGLPLKGFLLPFLDAMLVAKAWKVVGTDGSTFSRFVQDVLWTTYHGLDIVQRG